MPRVVELPPQDDGVERYYVLVDKTRYHGIMQEILERGLPDEPPPLNEELAS